MKKLGIWALVSVGELRNFKLDHDFYFSRLARCEQIDIVGQIGQDHKIECGVDCTTSNWYWRPSAYGGWGYDCTSRKACRMLHFSA